MNLEHHESGDILSQAVVHGSTVYLCGLTASDRDQDIAGQTLEVLSKIDDRLARCGSDKSKLLSVTIYLTDIAHKPVLNDVWTAWLGDLKRPARTCVGNIGLVDKVLVEITVTAAVNS